jgi:hypothetical protein
MDGALRHPKSLKMAAVVCGSIEWAKGNCGSLRPLKKTRGLSG